MEQSKKKFLKNMVGFSMVTWISFVISFIATPIATRLFVPEEYGRISVFMSYASLFGSACYLGLDQAFVRFFNEPPGGASRKGLLAFCAIVPLAACAVCALPAAFMWGKITSGIAGEPNFTVFVCLFVFGVCQVAFRFLSLSYRMEQNALLYTVQGVLYAVITRLAYLCVGFGDASGITAVIVLTLFMGAFTLGYILVQRRRFSFAELKSAGKPFFGVLAAYALPLVPLTVLAELSNNISKLALNGLLGRSATAVYSSALGLAATINIVQTGFNTYWAPYVFENYKGEGARRFYEVHKLMACLLAIFGLGISLFQEPLFLLLGKDYRGAMSILPFLFISPICYCLGETTCMGIEIAKRTHWTTIIFALSAALNIGLCYLLIPAMGLAGAALASAFSAIITMLMRTVIGNYYYKMLMSYRYIIFTVTLMLAASFASLYLTGFAKYAALTLALSLGIALFRREIQTLWTAAIQILSAGAKRLGRGRGKADE